MDLTDKHKREVERKIVETIIHSLESGSLTAQALPTLASFILEKIKSVKTHENLVTFIEALSGRWPIFVNLLALESGEVKEAKEDEIAEHVLVLAKSGRIDEALRLAKSITSGGGS